MQSAEYSPQVLQIRLLEFIDNFYNQIFDKETFNKYKNGVLNRIKAGYSGLEHESDGLHARLLHFSLDPCEFIDWDRRQVEIDAISKISFEEMKDFYKVLFNPGTRRTSKSFHIDNLIDYFENG